ncbi:HNH endonuclease [Litorilinea aerophila]|uniref:HNH endonuclease n=1 Tax=Litorilinea aerophila TaxID=1204385 RepID=A0A540VBD7_9CHLR|nr:HNH endonuclease [Litorilinea aerophila]MCC9078115.1 HNH endonuclease [Litorilinea aerophila]GIV77973.1 MAG: HNH endonuclease [Litorilinea sp.]
MSKQVLVLNASYEPLSLVSVRRAIVLLLREKAELLEATQQMLHSSSCSMPVPLVIRLVHYVRLPHRRVPATRAAVMLRDAYTCQYCGDAPGRTNLTVDHVVPRSRGGSHGWENLVTACTRCNQKKGSLTPEEAGMSLRRKPFEPSYVALVLLSNPVAAARWEDLVNGSRETIRPIPIGATP